MRYLLLLLSITSSLAALPNWMCHPEITVEGLYLHPSTCELDFVIQDERPFEPGPMGTAAFLPGGKTFSIRPDFDGGFRIALGYTIPPRCLETRLISTNFCSQERRSFKPMDGGSLWPTIIHPRYTEQTPLFAPVNDEGLASISQAKGNTDYYTLQFEVAKAYAPKRCLYLRPYTALQIAYLESRLEAFYRGTGDPGEDPTFHYRANASWEKCSWGVGPLFGSDARYTLGYGFGAGAHLQIGVMAGQMHGKIKQVLAIEEVSGGVNTPIVNQEIDLFRGYRMLIFPFFEAKLGVNYLWRCGKQFHLLIELGYDFISYINSVERFRFNDERGTGSSTCESFNLDGIYLQFILKL